MAKPFCMNDTNSDATQYSGPIPLIGLYVAGATSVCLLLMLLDTIAGIRCKNLYIPCRFFSINSATLTLIGVASKLSVDLTTYMPSARDQLSKLTGTTMICICIGFFMPALGANRESESIANMIALSLLVITICVNICIQMSTGVIFSFMVEHIVILCCLLTLLFMLWCSVLGNRGIKSRMADENKFAFRRCWRTKILIDRLKIWYMNGRAFNPQLIFCDDYSGVVVDIVCILCLVVVSQAAFRSLILNKFEFCRGISDYGWSMWIIIITQIVTIIIGGLTIGFRWLALILLNTMIHYDIDLRRSLKGKLDVLSLRFYFVSLDIVTAKIDNFFIQFSLMKTKSVNKFIVSVSQVLLRLGLLVLFILIFFIIAFVPLCVSIILVKFIMLCCPTSNSKETREEYDSLKLWLEEMKWRPPCLYQSSLWMGRQCVKDMNKWMNREKKEEPTNDYMVQMLPKRVEKKGEPTNDYMVQMLIKKEKKGEPTNDYMVQMLPKRDSSFSVSDRFLCLFMVLLVKILSVSIDSDLTENLRRTFEKAFEIIYFIDGSVNVKKHYGHRSIHELAKLLWTSGDIDISKMDLKDQSFGSVDYVISVIDGLIKKHLGADLNEELKRFKKFIQAEKFKTDKELCDYSEKLFADILHSFLAQLPIAIFKEFDLSPVEEYEERAEHIFKLLRELHPSLEEKVQWVFPADLEVSSFFDFQNRSANSQTRTTQKDVGASTSYDVVSSTSSDVKWV